MTATFIAPTPNCGHGGVTFTHDPDRKVWLCPLCLASLGGLLPRCIHCGGPLPIRVQTARTTHRTCTGCARERADARREESTP